MVYEEVRPVPALASVVERLWTLEGHASALGGDPQPVLPDGRPELVLHLGDAFDRLGATGDGERQASLLFAGQLTGQLLLRPTGLIRVLGVRFHPHGAPALVRAPLRDLAGCTLDLGSLFAPLARALGSVRDTARDLREAAALVQRVLLGAMDPTRIDPRIEHAVRAIDRRAGRVSIDRLAFDAGVSRRHLERGFLQHVGVSPKRLARIARFQRALRFLERADADRRGTITAAACGYADQAHFVRDFRDLAGCAPTEHLMNKGILTGFFSGAPGSAID